MTLLPIINNLFLVFKYVITPLLLSLKLDGYSSENLNGVRPLFDFKGIYEEI